MLQPAEWHKARSGFCTACKCQPGHLRGHNALWSHQTTNCLAHAGPTFCTSVPSSSCLSLKILYPRAASSSGMRCVITMEGFSFPSWIIFSSVFQYFCTGVWPARLQASKRSSPAQCEPQCAETGSSSKQCLLPGTLQHAGKRTCATSEANP